MNDGPFLHIEGLSVSFATRAGRLQAVVDAALELAAGETLGLVGESGCGKTTLARAIAGLVMPDHGLIELEGKELPVRRSRSQRRAIQLVFQDPFSSLNPRLSVRQVLVELLRAHGIAEGGAAEARCRELLDLVGLSTNALDRKPGAFSGGQRQRIAIARALAVEPKVLLADEPTSALDVSVQATVLKLLDELRSSLALGIVLISHDLAAVRQVCDRISVMYLGRIVETAPKERVFEDPRHPYTRALLAAAPRLTRVLTPRGRLQGEPPSPLEAPKGCPFHPRCPRAEQVCETDAPSLLPIADASGVAACHFREEAQRAA